MLRVVASAFPLSSGWHAGRNIESDQRAIHLLSPASEGPQNVAILHCDVDPRRQMFASSRRIEAYDPYRELYREYRA
jgi:hypothetical protein